MLFCVVSPILKFNSRDSGRGLWLSLSEALPIVSDALLQFQGFIFVLVDDAIGLFSDLHRADLNAAIRTFTSSFSANSRNSLQSLTSIALPAFYYTILETLSSAFLSSSFTERNRLRLCYSLSSRQSTILDLCSWLSCLTDSACVNFLLEERSLLRVRLAFEALMLSRKRRFSQCMDQLIYRSATYNFETYSLRSCRIISTRFTRRYSCWQVRQYYLLRWRQYWLWFIASFIYSCRRCLSFLISRTSSGYTSESYVMSVMFIFWCAFGKNVFCLIKNLRNLLLSQSWFSLNRCMKEWFFSREGQGECEGEDDGECAFGMGVDSMLFYQLNCTALTKHSINYTQNNVFFNQQEQKPQE